MLEGKAERFADLNSGYGTAFEFPSHKRKLLRVIYTDSTEQQDGPGGDSMSFLMPELCLPVTDRFIYALRRRFSDGTPFFDETSDLLQCPQAT